MFFEADRIYYATHRNLVALPIRPGTLHIYPGWAQARETARRELTDADAAIVTSYCSDAVPATELIAECGVASRVFYDLDTPVTLDAQRNEPVDYIGPRGLADYDLVLSYTGGEALRELQTRLGAPCRPALRQRRSAATPSRRAGGAFRCDLSYLGTYAADRQGTLEALFIEPSRGRPHQRFLIGGAQYPASFPWAPNIFFVQHLEPAQHSAFFSSSRLTLNVTRRAMMRMGYCPSGRVRSCGVGVHAGEHRDGLIEQHGAHGGIVDVEVQLPMILVERKAVHGDDVHALEHALALHALDGQRVDR